MADTAVLGIFQGDLIFKSAVDACLAELRQNPNLIDDALASLPQDDITADRYGNKTITACREWFLATDIDVRLGLKFTNWDKPATIAIELGNSNENEATLGDKNYETSEPHPRKPGFRRAIESVHADESYTVAIFASGEPEYMLFLYSLVLFQLMRRKQDLLEARGFEVSKFQVGVAAQVDPQMRELLYMRAISFHGKVRHSWPKQVGQVIDRVTFVLRAMDMPAPKLPLPEDFLDRDSLAGFAGH